MLELLEPRQRTLPSSRDYLSYSAIKTYQGCPLRYHFKYNLGLPETVVASSLLFGAGIHAALQAFFEALLTGEGALGQDELLGAFWSAWEARETEEVRYGKGEDLSTIGSLADRVLRAFLASDLSRPPGRILGVEEELRGTLVHGLPDLLARIDLLTETDEALIVTDYKTSRTHWEEPQVASAADQLLLYHNLVGPLANGKPVQLEFAVLTKTKFPSVTCFPVEYDPRQVDRTKRIVEKVWHAITAEHFYPNPSPMQCPTCPFRKSCAAWGG